MQWMLGDVDATAGSKGVGSFLGKAVRGKASGWSLQLSRSCPPSDVTAGAGANL